MAMSDYFYCISHSSNNGSSFPECCCWSSLRWSKSLGSLCMSLPANYPVLVNTGNDLLLMRAKVGERGSRVGTLAIANVCLHVFMATLALLMAFKFDTFWHWELIYRQTDRKKKKDTVLPSTWRPIDSNVAVKLNIRKCISWQMPNGTETWSPFSQQLLCVSGDAVWMCDAIFASFNCGPFISNPSRFKQLAPFPALLCISRAFSTLLDI